MSSMGKINKDKELKALISVNTKTQTTNVQSDDKDLIDSLNKELPNSNKLDNEHLELSTPDKDTKQQVWAKTLKYYNSKNQKPEMNIQFKSWGVLIGIIATLAIIGIFIF